MNTRRIEAIRFFRKHAMTVTPGALLAWSQLARAEEYARLAGFTVEWDWDTDADLGDHDYWCVRNKQGRACSHEILCAILRDASGDVRASLGGIIDPDRNCRRVIEAELACEAMPGDVP